MQKSLGLKITALFLGLIVLPLLVTYFITDQEIKKITRAENRNKLMLAYRMVNNFLESRKSQMQVKVRNTAEKLSYCDTFENSLKSLQKDNEFTGVVLFDGSSEISLGEKITLPEGLSSALLRMSELEQWKSLLLCCSDSLLLVGVSPVTRSGKPNATLVCINRLASDFLDPFFEITKIQILIYNQSGKALATTLFSYSGTRYLDEKLASEVKSEVDAQGFVVKSRKILNERYLAGFDKMQITDGRLYIMAGLPGIAISTTDTLLLNHLLLITAVAITLAIIVAFLLSRNIVVPLRIFSHTARTIADGNFDCRIKMRRKDEIGVLVSSFNEMAGKLKDSYDNLNRKIYEITTLYKIAQLVNFENNSETLLKKILAETCIALKSEKASIYLLNPQTDELGMRMVFGVPEGMIKQRVFLHLGEGIAGKVLKEGEGIIINEGEHHPLFKKPENTDVKFEIRNLMCVPLKMKDSAFGVLNVTNTKEASVYTESDFNLLTAIASQVAINIENTKLYELSVTDGLTRLHVHRYMQVRLEEEMVRARRYKHQLSFLLMDIDFFKKFNDTYGHQTGDLVLKAVAEAVNITVRQNVDITARYGGEEFAVIAPECNSTDAVNLAERIRKRIEETPLKTSRYGELKITLSIGVATYPVNSLSKSDLIAAADEALYKAKHEGRNRVCLSTATIDG
ncbi:MAG: diguanylate cyclase [Candidatus Wallbacteria bacterium]|nr:diguanylate cyclase [Candidatus Wallbacteria bacterium]